jgi:glycine/D-amino acid oxidase-like deaminating enzyme
MVDGLREEYEESLRLGHDVDWLEADAVRAHVDSPTYRAGLWRRGRTAIVDPARLAWGLARACEDAGVRVFEDTPVRSLSDGPLLVCERGRVRAGRVALATSAFPALVRRVRPYILPVYDYVLMTEPLDAARLGAIGWAGRQGILWGGYDAVYHWRNGLRDELDQNPSVHAMLAQHFFETFPQLDGIRFTHRWGGAIDTCSRFSAFWGRAQSGRVAWSVGYTGLGVGASRWGAAVMLDLLDGVENERTRLRMVRRTPLPFPPEPLRSGVVNLTRWSLARADAHAGRRNLWLRALDRVGLGFDS